MADFTIVDKLNNLNKHKLKKKSFVLFLQFVKKTTLIQKYTWSTFTKT